MAGTAAAHRPDTLFHSFNAGVHIPTTFTKKIACITGAKRGIGLETARQLGAAGMFPVLGARFEQAGRDAVAQRKAEGIEAEVIVFDVTRKSHCATSVRLALLPADGPNGGFFHLGDALPVMPAARIGDTALRCSPPRSPPESSLPLPPA